MSFGLRDEDWVDPDPEVFVRCGDCDSFVECPCGCGWGFCGREPNDEAVFMRREDGCYQRPEWRG